MEDFLALLPSKVTLVCNILGALVVIATVIVRFTPSKKDDEVVSKIAKLFYKLVGYLPTLGVNPQTKKYKEAYEKLKEQSSLPPKSDV